MTAFVVIGIIGYSKGNPSRLGVPYDPDGNGCGIDGKAKAYPYLYYTTPWGGYFRRYACVKTCPNFLNETSRPAALECLPNKIVTNCASTNVTVANLATVFTNSNFMNSSVFIYNSSKLLGRFCMPRPDILKNLNVTKQFNFGEIEEYMTDLKTVWPIFFACLGIAFAIGFLYMILLRWCSGIMTWLAIIAYLAVLIYLGVLFWNKGADYSTFSIKFNSVNTINQLRITIRTQS